MVIHADQPVAIGYHPLGPVHLVGKQAAHLLDAALVHPVLLHHPHQQAQVDGQHGDIGARLGHQRLADADPGVAAKLGQLQVDRLGGAVQVLLGVAYGAVPIEGIGGCGANIGVGHRLYPGSQAVGGLQGLHPLLPVLAPHHSDGIADLLAAGQRQGLLHQGIVLQAEPPAGEGLPRGLEHGAHPATIRQHPLAAGQ